MEMSHFWCVLFSHASGATLNPSIKLYVDRQHILLRYFSSRDSIYFSTRFAQLDIRGHEPLSTRISLGDIERKDFDAFLSVLYPE